MYFNNEGLLQQKRHESAKKIDIKVFIKRWLLQKSLLLKTISFLAIS